MAVAVGDDNDADTLDLAQLIRLGSVVSRTRLLFTTKEVTQGEPRARDYKDGRRSRSHNLSEVVHCCGPDPLVAGAYLPNCVD